MVASPAMSSLPLPICVETALETPSAPTLVLARKLARPSVGFPVGRRLGLGLDYVTLLTTRSATIAASATHSGSSATLVLSLSDIYGSN